MKHYTVMAITLGVFILSSCTSIGSHVISNPKIYLSEPGLFGSDIERFDIQNKELCLDEKSTCIKYLYGKAYQSEDFPADAFVHYTLDATGNGVRNHFTYKASASTFNQMDGTVVLFHGFGATKETMLVTSIYFRALGMDVIAVDLFGHGESSEDFAFGAKEHEVYTRLLDAINAEKALIKPVLSVGHSMGALPAMNIMLGSGVIDGAILLAPMIEFNTAAKFYLAYKSPLLNRIFSENIDEIISSAMQARKVSSFETDIPTLMQRVKKHTLVINSDVDTVSPVEKFTNLGNQFIHAEVFKGRSHPSLIAFDNDDAKIIESWIRTHFDEKVSMD